MMRNEKFYNDEIKIEASRIVLNLGDILERTLRKQKKSCFLKLEVFNRHSAMKLAHFYRCTFAKRNFNEGVRRRMSVY